jgi:hypothetical protein
MEMTIPTFSDTVVRQLANVLEAAASHREFTALFNECKIVEQGGTPKWERINLALTFRQRQDGCGNNIVVLVQAVMNPVRFVGQTNRFEEFRHRLNEVIWFLATFSGLVARQGKFPGNEVEHAGHVFHRPVPARLALHG